MRPASCTVFPAAGWRRTTSVCLSLTQTSASLASVRSPTTAGQFSISLVNVPLQVCVCLSVCLCVCVCLSLTQTSASLASVRSPTTAVGKFSISLVNVPLQVCVCLSVCLCVCVCVCVSASLSPRRLLLSRQ